MFWQTLEKFSSLNDMQRFINEYNQNITHFYLPINPQTHHHYTPDQMYNSRAKYTPADRQRLWKYGIVKLVRQILKSLPHNLIKK